MEKMHTGYEKEEHIAPDTCTACLLLLQHHTASCIEERDSREGGGEREEKGNRRGKGGWGYERKESSVRKPFEEVVCVCKMRVQGIDLH